MSDVTTRSRGPARPGDRRGPAEARARRSAPRVDPRIAQRWIDARRQEGRRRLRIVVALLGVAVLVAAGVGSLYTPVFALRHVRITESGPPPAGAPAQSAIRGLAGLDGRHLMVDVNPSAVAARLDADPWLGAVRVSRHWPSTVTISVETRRVLAVVRRAGAGGYAELDASGRVLADVVAEPSGVPLLDWSGPLPGPGGWLPATAGPGVGPGAPAPALADLDARSDATDVPVGAGAALAVLSDLPAAERTGVVSIAAGSELTVVFAPPSLGGGHVSFVFGDGSQLQAKVTAMVTLVGQADLTGVTSVDLTVPNRPEAQTAPSSTGSSP